MKNLFGYLLIIVFAIGAGKFLGAVQKKEARVTQVIKDVRVLAPHAAPRIAVVNDSVVEGNAVRTGGDSRAELTFTDQTLTRIGANTVFTFGEGAKDFDLASGAMLLAVPKQNGTIRVSVGAATAAVTGFTAMFEKGNVNKMVLLEGQGSVSFTHVSGPCNLKGGQMFVWPRDPTTCPPALDVDVCKVIATSKLVTLFSKLPKWSWEPIQVVCDRQQSNPAPEGYTDPTGHDNVDQKNAGEPMPPPPRITRPIISVPPSF